jgi:hypothetical protein
MVGMRLMLASFAMLGVAIASGAPAVAEPLVLRCVGNAISVSPYEPTAIRTATQRFYRIDQQQFSRFMPADVVWSSNRCTTKGAACSIEEDTLNARWMDGRDPVTVQINRKSGRAIEKDGLTDFLGDCAPSSDPAQSTGPNRF